jgi:hypothetical protein
MMQATTCSVLLKIHTNGPNGTNTASSLDRVTRTGLGCEAATALRVVIMHRKRGCPHLTGTAPIACSEGACLIDF